MTRIQIFRVVMLMAALVAAASAFAANVIPNPLELPLDPVGERLTPAQEKLIEGAWCRKHHLGTQDPASIYVPSPASIDQEYRFKKIDRSVFSASHLSDGYKNVAAHWARFERLPEQAVAPTSETDNVQITMDKDGLFVVTKYKTQSQLDVPPPVQREEKILHRIWARIQRGKMQFVYWEGYRAFWLPGEGRGGQPAPQLSRNPKQKYNVGPPSNEPNEPWKRCDR